LRESACVIITCAISGRALARRAPLQHVILPGTLVPEWIRHGRRRVWWIESEGRKRILRALFEVDSVLIDREVGPEGSGRLVINEKTAERITWSRGPTLPRASVPYPLPSCGIVAISNSEDGQMEEVRSSAPDFTSLAVAHRQLTRLFRQTLGERPPIASTSLTIEEAYSHVRRYFARAELFDVGDPDPFELAARVLSNAPPLPFRTGHDDMPPFQEFKTQLGENYVIASSNSLTTPPRRELERATIRHLLIVEELADAVRRRGLRPRYNQHVDLEVSDYRNNILFEVKTCNKRNFVEQMRSAVGQLLEYSYRLNGTRIDRRRIRLAAVLETTTDTVTQVFARGFLSSVGVEVVFWRGTGRGFDGLDTLLDFSATCFGERRGREKTASAIASKSPT
jgi:hypothetical protein